MVGKSVIRSRIIKSRGFSLLEIIIALSIIGIVLVSLATYARKVIDEHVRQVDAEAIAQEVYGVLQFVNADTIEIFRSNNPDDKTTNRTTKKVTNPLYQLPQTLVYPDAEKGTPDAVLVGLGNNPIWQANSNHDVSIELDPRISQVSPYVARYFSKSITSPITNTVEVTDGTDTRYSHSHFWSEAKWGRESVRSYFTDSGCMGRGQKPADKAVYFKQQFLSCNENPALRNSEIAVSRIDLVNGDGGYVVGRVDVYVSFTPVDGNPARLEQFITPLITAFRTKKIVPNMNNAYLVMSVGPDKNNSWTLLNKNKGAPADINTSATDLATITDLPSMTGRLQHGRIYGIRFSFDGSGDYLRTDGLNAATKLCWNTAAGEAGPCLTSPSDELLVLKSRKNSTELANLQASSVISMISREVKDKQGKVTGTEIVERYTVPRIQYKAFANTGDVIKPVSTELLTDGNIKFCLVGGVCGEDAVSAVINYDTISDPANGAIPVKLQVCPVVDGWTRDPMPRPDNPDNPDNHRLYPRLSASVSSVISGIKMTTTGAVDSLMPEHVFDNQSHISEALKIKDFSVNRMGGVTLQTRLVGENWIISGMVASESTLVNHPSTYIYYNPSWLSVMITTWCSSEQQP